MAPRLFLLSLLLAPVAGHAQVIPFESNGLQYEALTRGGMTIMFAQLPTRIHGYTILQVSISNGSPIAWTVRPEDFHFQREDGGGIQALPAVAVINTLLAKASRGDVSKLISAYEAALYGNTEMHSTNGYEARRESAESELVSTKLKAAATASAIALVTNRLAPGQSTDGAVFFENGGRALGSGKLMVMAAGEKFDFPVEGEAPLKSPHPGH